MYPVADGSYNDDDKYDHTCNKYEAAIDSAGEVSNDQFPPILMLFLPCLWKIVPWILREMCSLTKTFLPMTTKMMLQLLSCPQETILSILWEMWCLTTTPLLMTFLTMMMTSSMTICPQCHFLYFYRWIWQSVTGKSICYAAIEETYWAWPRDSTKSGCAAYLVSNYFSIGLWCKPICHSYSLYNVSVSTQHNQQIMCFCSIYNNLWVPLTSLLLTDSCKCVGVSGCYQVTTLKVIPDILDHFFYPSTLTCCRQTKYLWSVYQTLVIQRFGFQGNAKPAVQAAHEDRSMM